MGRRFCLCNPEGEIVATFKLNSMIAAAARKLRPMQTPTKTDDFVPRKAEGTRSNAAKNARQRLKAQIGARQLRHQEKAARRAKREARDAD